MKRVSLFILDIALNGFVFYGLFLVLSFMFYSIVPTSFLYSYSSVEPKQDTYQIGVDKLTIISKLDVYYQGNMAWNDVLRCIGDTGYLDFFSQYNSNADNVSAGLDKTSNWIYRGVLPDSPTTCRMYSSITRTLPMGVEKQQDVVSKEFEFIE